MADTTVRSVMITGANSGIGKELARQLAMHPEVEKVLLACRNAGRARAAQAELEALTGRKLFDVVILDTSDPESVRSAVRELGGPIDAVVMNAGGTGGPEPGAVTATGAISVVAVNVLGHVALLDALIDGGVLGQVAVLTGSEAARGVPKLFMPRPAFRSTSVDELVSAIDGSYWASKRFDPAAAYGHAKYIAALWMGAMARQHAELRFVTMSPGGTAGSHIADSMPRAQRLAFKLVVTGRLGQRLGLSHPLPLGAARLLGAVTDSRYADGVFFGSRAHTLTGPIVDQATIFSDLADPSFQDNADAALHRFL
ncbi:MAG: SDR family NAD(P)-dependent oxidoreductase [Solirubrobacterales bacterium]|nr:SDR family NAD(P)-dependent oxidoreductase [Solirubrobacterales bacterium]